MKKIVLINLIVLALINAVGAQPKQPAPPETLKDASLEGVWYMKSGVWGKDKLGEGIYRDVTVVKMYSYPRFSFAYYNEKENKFVGAGGGTYQFDGKTLTENIEYWSWGKPKFPVSVFRVQLKNNSYIQEGWENGLTEEWERSKQ